VDTTHVDIIDKSIEKTNVWINELAEELGTDDRRYAYRVLRAFLQTLRDRLSVDEAAQLAAQLPQLIRGVYYEGWDPSKTPQTYRHPNEFLERVASEAALHGQTEASHAAAAAARVLYGHVSEGELSDVFQLLPHEIRVLLQ
jgi:uncharacterized protein (DUF2267 family)